MKKSKFIGAVSALMIPILLTGCGKNQVLTCVQEESVSSLEYKIEFKKEELDYLRTIRFLKPDYIEFLRIF